jgi:hypothetical protein
VDVLISNNDGAPVLLRTIEEETETGGPEIDWDKANRDAVGARKLSSR